MQIITIKQLIKYSLQESDNNACDKLFDISGGIDDMDVYVNKIGLKNTVLKFNENQMQQDISRVYDNWSTVLDAAKLFEIVFFSNKLPNDEYTDFLREALKECKTGKDRIPQKLNDESIIIAHKTGSGPKNKYGKFIATNDVGTIWLDNGKHYTIAVFVKDSEEVPQINASIIADISRMVYDYLK